MPAILPLAVLIILFLIYRQKNYSWRSAILSSAVVWGALLTFITEILSLLKILTFGWLLGIWGLITVGLGVFYRASIKGKRQIKRSSNARKQESISREPILKFLLLGIVLIVATIGLIALVAPPNTMDSMHYHMVRVVYWIQNHTVGHYPTYFTPQLFLSPWAEFAILHLQILAGGDYYANLVEWFSMVGSIIGTSLIAKQLGANLYGQIFAAVFCATIPMGILQASGTQNDYVVAFWLVCLVHYILQTIQGEAIGKTNFLKMGAILGLGILTKPTAYLYAFPFFIWLFVPTLKTFGKQIWKPMFEVAISALVLNLFHYVRNFKLFHSPLGKTPDDIVYNNRAFGISELLSNIIKNLSLHLSTPVPSINRFLENVVTQIHSVILHTDVNNPLTSSSNFQFSSLINHEDLAGNALHLLLIICSIVGFGLYWTRKKLPLSPVLNYLLCLIGGFLIFCIVLAWTPFNSRLQLSLFVLFSAFVGCVFSTILKRRLANFLAAPIIICSLPWVLLNETRPVIANSSFVTTGEVRNIFNTSRIDQYFVTRIKNKEPFKGASEFLKSQGCYDIGMVMINSFEYPLWIILEQDKKKVFHYQHIAVDNISANKYQVSPYKDFQPCAVFYRSNRDGKVADTLFWQGNYYDLKWSSDHVGVLMKR
ncbi:MAG: hypothetical protein U7127_02110 [Phormidium sp.]